jgi:ABC-type polysaccharide/polyol phosphate export permease|tara:strand:+ start:1692 stop:2519 length:828 start_codon:yes stop_codon:yes gene_type:complete
MMMDHSFSFARMPHDRPAGGSAQYLREVLAARMLIRNFLIQDMKLKYRRSMLGFLWTLLNPVLMLLVLTLAFTFIFDRRYPLHLFATLLPWQFFASSLAEGGQSIIKSHTFLLNWNVPKLIFPLRHVLFRFCEYIFALIGLFSIAWLIGFRPTTALFILPLSIVLLFLVALGLGTILSVFSIYFRDTHHLLDVVLRGWFYLTPVIIPFEHIPERIQPFFKLNPMYYLLEMFDAPITRGVWPASEVVTISCLMAIAACAGALAVLSRFEDDVVFRL